MTLLEAFSMPFMQRALVTGLAVAACGGVLGLFLVLRRYSSMGDGLAHVGLASVALGLLAGIGPVYVTVPVTALASLWIRSLSERTGLFGETAVGLVSSLAAALAVLLASLGKGFSADLVSYLFGSVLSVGPTEAWVSSITAVAVLTIVVAFRRPLFSMAYDPDFARVSGVDTNLFGKLLAVLAGLTVAVGMRVVGSLLVSSLLILPPVAALQLGLGFGTTMAFSAGFALVSVLAGLAAAVLLDLPAGASVVLANFILFCAAWLYGKRFSPGSRKGARGGGHGEGTGAAACPSADGGAR